MSSSSAFAYGRTPHNDHGKCRNEVKKMIMMMWWWWWWCRWKGQELGRRDNNCNTTHCNAVRRKMWVNDERRVEREVVQRSKTPVAHV